MPQVGSDRRSQDQTHWAVMDGDYFRGLRMLPEGPDVIVIKCLSSYMRGFMGSIHGVVFV